MAFLETLENRIQNSNSLLCVGLDADYNKLPQGFLDTQYPQYTFNTSIVDATHDLVCAYKPNSAFYEARGAQGIRELQMTCNYLKENHPDIPIILDAKRADIGNTNNAYISFIFDYLNADAVTIHPYLGKKAVQPFLDRKNKGVIVLCRTSNPGADEFQDLSVNNKTLYKIVAKNVYTEWNQHNNCMLVVGATYPKELADVRSIVNDMYLLVPGIGAQGGDVEKTVTAGLNSQSKGMIVNSSRGIIFAQDPRMSALTLRDEINKYR